jgi:hypothetical protein
VGASPARTAIGHSRARSPRAFLRARDHRAEKHPELPVESPSRKPSSRREEAKRARREQVRAAVAILLREGVIEASAKTISDRAPEYLPPSAVAAIASSGGLTYRRQGRAKPALWQLKPPKFDGD